MTMESAQPRTRAGISVAALAVVSGLLWPSLPAAVARQRAGRTAAADPNAHTPADTPRVLGLPAGFRPQGVAAHGGTLYVSSSADGRILAVDLRSGRSRILLAASAGRSLRGLAVDPRTGLLFAAGTDTAGGVVLAVDHRSGRVVRRWVVPGATRLADLTVSADAVWVTDSGVDRLTRIPLDRAGRPARSSAVGELLPGAGRPMPQGLRADAIRALPDGSLLLTHTTAGGLRQVSPDGGTVRAVPVTGGPALTGGDGLVLDGDRLWVIRGTGRDGAVQLRLERRRGTLTARWVRELTDRSLDLPSTAALTGGRLWTVCARFTGVAPACAGYWLVGLPLGR